jgi:hypothetical protein
MTIIMVCKRLSAISAVFVPQLTFWAIGPRFAAAGLTLVVNSGPWLCALTFCDAAAPGAQASEARPGRMWLAGAAR